MDLFAPKHLLLILLIVLLVFGGKKIKTLGSDLGAAFRGFKKAMNEGETEEPAKQIPAPPAGNDAEFPEVASGKPEQGSEHKTAPRA
ncbi:MAG TPA: twin-arginine translocase TatA/TatE family subunit [Steroidobacteraceae bacterium]|jgi:sec-independent protein translocase protein TatA